MVEVVDNLTSADEGLILSRALLDEVLDEDGIVRVELDTLGRVVDDDNTIHVSAEETEVLGVDRAGSEPNIVAADDMVKGADTTISGELADDRAGGIISRSSPQDEFETTVAGADVVEEMDNVGAEDGSGAVGAAVVDEGFIKIKNNSDHRVSVRVVRAKRRKKILLLL